MEHTMGIKITGLDEVKKNVVGKLDQICDDLFRDDIYSRDRLSNKTRPKDLGTVENDDSWNIQFYWWNSETISNYYDGLMRYGFLLNNETIIRQIDDFVNHILESQDDDGYIGIYDKELRYKTLTENGELWAKATMYRVLLGYYMYTNKEYVLDSVIKAVDNVMENFPIYKSTPFAGEKTFAGVAHGLMFVDVLYSLYEITNDYDYIDYIVFLYEDYNKHEVSEEDVLVRNLRDRKYKFRGHGVHTYEHLRVIAIVSKYASKYSDLYELYKNKLELALSPSGGPIGDEWVSGCTAKADMNGYEFCSIHELMDSLLFLSELGVDNSYKLAEKLFINANFGARHNNTKTIAYLKSDDSYEMKGSFQFEQKHSPHTEQVRYKYSPSHQDAAVCCVPNSVRLIPYYLEHSITIADKVYVNYIVPISSRMIIDNKEYYLNIYQDTMFGEYVIDTNLGNLLELPRDRNHKLKEKRDHFGNIYFEYNNIVFALPIDSTEVHVKDHKFHLHDTHLIPEECYHPYKYITGTSKLKLDSEFPKVEVTLVKNGMKYNKILSPIAMTDLRQVTFKTDR